MSGGSAYVSSLEVLAEFRAALATFREEVVSGLTAVDLENRRTLDWLQHEQLQFWQHQTVKWEEKVQEAKNELHRKKVTSAGEHNSLVEERQLLKKAQMRLEEAREKTQVVRKWQREVLRAVEEYQAHAGAATAMLDMDIPKAMGLIDKQLKSLEAYVESTLPTASSQSASSVPTTTEPLPSPVDSEATETSPNSASAPGTDTQ